MMRALTLFSGVEGFGMGLEAAGMTVVGQCEIDPHCRKVLRRHWPDAHLWDDVTTLTGRQVLDECGPVDVVAFGSPCQDLSVAGRRAGLSGARSSLFLEAVRIINELDRADAPVRWAIWENVAGALSSNAGRDFGTVLDELADVGALVVEWAVLDARWFGVPQRRRRVFVVAGFDPRADGAGPLLPVGARLPGGADESGTAGQIASALTRSGLGGSGGVDDNTAQAGHLTVTYAPATTNTIAAKWAKGTSGPAGDEHHNLIALTVTAASNARPSIATTAAVRRLTPRECERLMGWPDDHTRWADDGSEIADSHRYRMCGNGVVSGVAQWVGEQIMRAEVAA